LSSLKPFIPQWVASATSWWGWQLDGVWKLSWESKESVIKRFTGVTPFSFGYTVTDHRLSDRFLNDTRILEDISQDRGIVVFANVRTFWQPCHREISHRNLIAWE
jgi:hypothetical protein